MTIRVPGVVEIGTNSSTHISVVGTFTRREITRSVGTTRHEPSLGHVPNADTFGFARFRVEGALMACRRALELNARVLQFVGFNFGFLIFHKIDFLQFVALLCNQIPISNI